MKLEGSKHGFLFAGSKYYETCTAVELESSGAKDI
jgi:hypothetical protein